MSTHFSKDEAIARIREYTEQPRAERMLRRISVADGFERRLYSLINRPTRAAYQDNTGSYPSRQKIGLKEFAFHLRGNDSIAVAAVNGEKANLLAIDIDAEFERRLPLVAEVLQKRGLDKASFATSGSAAGRGKVVVTLKARLPQRQAIRLVQSITNEVTEDPRFGHFKPNDLTTWPQRGDGGHVRILGRNLKPKRTRGHVGGRTLLEVPMDLEGNLSDLWYVEPADIVPELARLRGKARLSTWAEDFMREPYVGSTPDLFKAQSRLAHEAVALYGKTGGVAFLSDVFHKIEEQSADLSASARRNLTRSDTVARLVEYACTKHAVGRTLYTLDSLWCPKENIDAPRPARQVYSALVEYVSERALDPFCFGITLDRMADLVGYSGKTKVKEAMLKAVSSGLMVILDPGLPKEDGKDGLCGLYGFVGQQDTPSSVLLAAQASPMYRERSVERVRRGYLPLAFAEADTLRAA